MTRRIGSCSSLCFVLSCLSAAATCPDAMGRAQPGPVDRSGDPLPEHARARLGSSRFHHGDSLHQVFYTPDGKSLVAIDNAGIVRVWDAATGRMIREIDDSDAKPRVISPAREIALSPDGKALAMIDRHPGRLRLWDVTSGRERRRLHQAKGESYEHPIFSPDARELSREAILGLAVSRKRGKRQKS